MTDTPTATDDKPDELTRLRDAVKTLRSKLSVSTAFLDLEAAGHAARSEQGKGETCKRQANANREALAATANLVEN